MLAFKSKDGMICLKEFEENDKEFIQYAMWLREYDNIKMIGRQEYLLSMNVNDIRAYVERLNASESDSFFKVYKEDTFIGTFKIGHINWRLGIADVGIMIGNPEYRGKGLAKYIMKTGIEYAFEILGLRRLEGGCFSSNISMCKCFESSGFVKEGVKREALMLGGAYYDHVLYGLLRHSY